ncbi:MAG: hypothetical protein NW215_07195 [Hyphomicrobiales bacterium]|nr:hypothetical protein [Hyphomicrobiales bacterium]
MVVMAPAIMAVVWMTFDRFDPIEAERFMKAHIDLVFNGLRARPS